MKEKEIALRVIPLLDLTSLNDDDNDATIDNLCRCALQTHVAAVCVWPRFVTRCQVQLTGSGINIATVVNFPHGGTDVGLAKKTTQQAIADGANEIDLVMPYSAWLSGDQVISQTMIGEVKSLCNENTLLKVILETGRLGTQHNIEEASRDAIVASADFLKTSTGKTSISATPEAAEAMLRVIRDTDRRVGFKASGGIRTVQQAVVYLDLADRIMGPDWVDSNTFRFGASGLLDDCERCLADIS